MPPPDAEASPSAVLKIQQRLRELFDFPEHEEPLTWLLGRWRQLTPKTVELGWERHGSDYYAWWNDFGIKIEPGRARSRGMQLRFRWPGGGSRIVAHGELAVLQAIAAFKPSVEALAQLAAGVLKVLDAEPYEAVGLDRPGPYEPVALTLHLPIKRGAGCKESAPQVP